MQRLTFASNTVHVATLVIAVGASLITYGTGTASVVAAIVAIVGVVVSLLATVPFPEKPVVEVTVIGVALTCYSISVWLTGGLDSTYTLLPIATIFLASAGGGLRFAGPSAAAATFGVLFAAVFSGVDGVSASLIRVPAFYAITAIAFSEIQRAVLARQALAADAELAADASETRKQSLAMTHTLLGDLMNVATSPGMNAVSSAQDAIRDIAVIFPSDASRIVDGSTTVLARRGPATEREPDHLIRSAVSDRSEVLLELWTTNGSPSDDQLDLIEQALEPASFAIDNHARIQEIAGHALHGERARLARELHDDIAPSIASVGLSLDMLLLTGQLDNEQTRNLEATRSNVSSLVERIRDRVQDLRADRSRSLTDYAHSLVAGVDADGPTVIVSLDERTPPRPAIAVEVRAIVNEVFRNALDHADASVITIKGRVDDLGGTIAIKDNGVGFDTGGDSGDRFGLIGIRERAAIINGEVSVKSSPKTGTLVAITWRNTR
jgi:signal transduction histidine kinase